jgi:ABC-type Zn uptake system ZnuABC Zn-binding protein ZnuA
MTVDALSLAQQLRAAELSPAQADAIAAAIGNAVIEGAATKGDLQELRTELKADIRQLRTEFKAEIQQLEARFDSKIEQLRSQMMIWFIATNLTIGAIVIAALKL